MKYNLGSAVRQKRNELGMTQTQFAALIKVDAGALSRIENGKELLTRKTLVSLAPFFDMTVEDLTDEWCSEKVALEIFHNQCSEKIHSMIEEKLKVIKSRNLTQGNLDL